MLPTSDLKIAAALYIGHIHGPMRSEGGRTVECNAQNFGVVYYWYL